MVGVRISTRTDLKTDIMDVYRFINESRSVDAREALRSARMNVIVYYNTRGLDCKELMPIFSDIENLLAKDYLNDPVRSRLCAERLFQYMFTLNKAMKFNLVDQQKTGEVVMDPVPMLRSIVDDLIDDYSEFNLSGGQEILQKNRGVLELIRNDLLEVREMEPHFRKAGRKTIESFNTVLKFVNMCLMILPQMKDVTIATKTQNLFRTYFEKLFNSMTDLFVPADVVQRPEPEQRTVERGEQTPVAAERKPTKREGEKKREPGDAKQEPENIDGFFDNPAELERKAREGVLEDEDEQGQG